ncbi:MAG: YHS domain-containing protein, partial [candidate division Zixibacteria bacterium]|nr:YHS domain-containing protein [candidate division Zixibacteria bacterium]
MKRLSLIALAILTGIVFLCLSFAIGGQDRTKVSNHKITQEEIGKDFTCVMCNMKGKVSKNTPALDYQGKAYYFCSAGEKESFSKQPDKYISSEKSGNKSLDYIKHKITAEELGKKATCPVTKENFTISKNTPAIEFKGEIYYFCCPGCIDKFINSQKDSD